MSKKGIYNLVNYNIEQQNQKNIHHDKIYFQGIPDEFSQGQIKVKCQYQIQMVSELEITRRLNQHGQVRVKGILQAEDSKCVWQAGSKDPIAIYGENDSGETLLFSGVVTELEVIYRNHIYYVEIKGLSWTSMLDYEEKSCSFQDKGMSYYDLIHQVLNDYPESKFIDRTNSSVQSIGQFILQYRETDWEFCKRLATHFNTQLVADVLGETPRFWFGLPKNSVTLNSAGGVAVKKATGKYHKAVASGFFVQEEQFVKYQILSKERLELGDIVEFDGRTMIVEESRAFLAKGILNYAYVLGLEVSLTVPKKMNHRIQGISLLGKVLERENQQVKLKLNVDKGQDTTTACWFPYASQANNLFYCMPEIGTSISLYFLSSDENSGIAMNAVRRNGGNCAKTSDPKLKYMGIPEGKEFKLGVTDIDFTANEKLFMNMDAGKGILIQSHKDLTVFTKQKLFMEAKELIKVFAKTGNIIVGAKEESSLYLLGGPDGDTHIKAGNNLIYAGRKKEIFTERLNEEIAYEEKKFDWGKLLGNVLIGLAAVAAVVAVVATGGAALVAMSAVAATTVSTVVAGAAVSGALAVGAMAVSDIIKGEVSDWQDYALAGVKGAIEGAISGAVLGIKALEGAKLITKMLASGGVSFLTDAISQGIEILYYGGSYDWGRGLLSFGIGFIMPAISKTIEEGINKLITKFGEKMSTWYNNALCKVFGDPVDVINGSVLYDVTDFELPGPLPLQWKRIWCSASTIMGHLGHGSRYNYEMGLEIFEEEHTIVVFLNDGRVCTFPLILVGEEAFDYKNRLLLKRMNNCYQLFEPESRYIYTLSFFNNGYINYRLTKIENRMGHKICFNYDNRGYLCKVVDSVGRELVVSTNAEGRITNIYLQEDNNRHLLVSYAYNKEQDLSGVTDALGKTTQMNYRNHLMIKKTDRDRNSFYWEYDKYEDGARAVRSWGDGDVLSIWIDYHDDEMYNTVRTGKNEKACEYHYNENKLCTRTVYADLTEIRENYDDKYQLLSRIDEEGRLTSFQYNEFSLLTEITQADSSKIQLVYDEDGRLIKKQNPEGDFVEWVYNEDDTLQRTIDEMGAETIFEYNQDKLVEKVWNNRGEAITLTYDKYKNLSSIMLPDGCVSEWKYDYRGNCLNFKSPLGAVETYSYDKLNRLINAKLADGNEVALTYNAYENIIHAKDKYTEVDFTYSILGNITSRTEGERKIQYRYNSEEQLISIINEKGEVYQFERDVKGNIIKETGYDKLVRSYELDYSGLVKKVKRPGGRFTQYTYDKLCRVIRADYHDNSYEEYGYNKNGMLTEVKNQYTTIKLERDKAGRIIKEWQDNYWVSSEYDKFDSRIKVSSSFGANILSKHDKMGQVTYIEAYKDNKKPWTSRIEYNVIGQEVLRQTSGGIISSFTYDEVGRPLNHKVSIGRKGLNRHLKYEWDVNYRLKKVTNELNKGNFIYSYDRFSNLVSAKGTEILSVFRTFDEVGNVYGTEDRSDRIYGGGSRLETSGIDLKEKRNTFQGGYGKLVTKGVEYFYDEEGNLARKTEADGSMWEYSYYGNGMLRKVVRPDKSVVIFKYDGLGRRIEKRVNKAGSEKVIPIVENVSSIVGDTSIAEGTWETIGGVRICRPNIGLQKSHVIKGNSQSIYAGEVTTSATSQKQTSTVEKVIRFLWDGNTLLHEWEDNVNNRKKNLRKIDYQVDYVVKLSEKKKQEAKENTAKEEHAPESLVTWIFQDDFIPRAKITKDGCYSIVTDYMGNPVEAYDEEASIVWRRELDINGTVMPAGKDSYGRTMKEVGEKNFIPFRFQGQYEDEEIGLYYNRFRYYDPETGQYTQQDPIGLAGGNPTLYGYVYNTLGEIDPFGLIWKDLLARGLGHHLFPRSVAKKLGISELAKLTALSWYPNVTKGSGKLHQDLHRLLREAGVPFHGSKFTENIDEFWKMADKAYAELDDLGYLKIPGTNKKLYEDVTPKQALAIIKELYESDNLPSVCGNK